MPISSVATVTAGTHLAIPTARKYHGANLYPDGTNAARVVIYRGGANTAGMEFASIRGPATESVTDTPQDEIDLDPEGGLYCVCTATGDAAIAVVRYGT